MFVSGVVAAASLIVVLFWAGVLLAYINNSFDKKSPTLDGPSEK